MFQYKLECDCGNTTEQIGSYVPKSVTKYCKNCLEAREHKPIDVKEIGECEFCKNPDDLGWECPDEPHHGEDTECGECGATYYRDYGGDIYTTNEQAKKNFPQLKTL